MISITNSVTDTIHTNISHECKILGMCHQLENVVLEEFLKWKLCHFKFIGINFCKLIPHVQLPHLLSKPFCFYLPFHFSSIWGVFQVIFCFLHNLVFPISLTPAWISHSVPLISFIVFIKLFFIFSGFNNWYFQDSLKSNSKFERNRNSLSESE